MRLWNVIIAFTHADDNQKQIFMGPIFNLKGLADRLKRVNESSYKFQ